MPVDPQTRLKGRCAELSLALAIAGLAGVWITISDQRLPEPLILGVIALVTSIVCGLIGKSRGGEARLIANIGIAVSGLAILFICTAPANLGHRETMRGAQFTNNLKTVGLALANYESVYGHYPPAVIRDAEGRPLYSWRVAILPFMEAGQLYAEFHLDEPWDSPHNVRLLEKSPLPYRGIGAGYDPRLTYIQAFTGKGSAFEGTRHQSLSNPDGSSNFPDGTDETILLAEAARGVPWSAPFDLPDPDTPGWPGLGGGYERAREMFALKPRVDRISVLFVDCTVRRLPWPMARERLQALITRNGAEPISPDDP